MKPERGGGYVSFDFIDHCRCDSLQASRSDDKALAEGLLFRCHRLARDHNFCGDPDLMFHPPGLQLTLKACP